MDLFDPAQLNQLILNSGLAYQFLKELEAKQEAKPETAFGYIADQSLKRRYGHGGMRNLPVFPFTASYLTPQDGVVLNIEHEDDLRAYHEADLIGQKVKAMDERINVKQIHPMMDPTSIKDVFIDYKL